MNPLRKKKKDYVKSIKTKEEYHIYMEKFMLSEQEKQLFDLIFIEDKNYRYIADFFGYTEQTIINKVGKILDKIDII